MDIKKYLNRTLLITGTVVAFGLLLFLFLSLMLGVKGPDSEKTTRIYFVDNISNAHQNLIRRFNEDYRGRIEVVPVNLPFTKFSTNERKELIARALRSKNDRIDVFTVDIIWVPRFAKWAFASPEYARLARSGKVLKYALQSCTFDSQLVALPFYIDVGLMYYRKDLLERLPGYNELAEKLKDSITWEEFIDLSRTCKRIYPDSPFYIFAADNYEGLICSFVETVAGQNEHLVEGDSVRLNTPAAEKGLQLLVDMVHKYRMTPPIVTKFDENHTYFYALRNDGIFLRGWPGLLRQYRHIMEDTTKLVRMEVAALPHFRGYPAVSVLGGWNMMISKSSPHKEAALEFIKYTLKRENQESMFADGGYIPVNNTVYGDSVFVGRFPELSYYRQLLDHGIHRPYLVDYTKISDIISYYVHQAILGELSAREALQKASHMINADRVLIK
ncbi:MAG: extracellular solute-binding protein [Calditrichia bacterium]